MRVGLEGNGEQPGSAAPRNQHYRADDSSHSVAGAVLLGDHLTECGDGLRELGRSSPDVIKVIPFSQPQLDRPGTTRRCSGPAPEPAPPPYVARRAPAAWLECVELGCGTDGVRRVPPVRIGGLVSQCAYRLSMVLALIGEDARVHIPQGLQDRTQFDLLIPDTKDIRV